MTVRNGRILFSHLVYLILVELMLCELSPENVNELCKDYVEMGIIPYPGKPNEFILCVGDNTTTDTGACKSGVCLNVNNQTATNDDPNDISYDAAKRFCETGSILEKVSFFDCQKYYVCAGKGKDPITVNCPAHQHFSKYEGKCTSPLEAYCLAPQYWCKNQADGLQFAAAKCFEYYECSNGGVSALKSCPYNQYFDKDRNQCVLGFCKDPSGRTDERKPDCLDYEEGDFLFHPECNKYYVCMKNQVYEGQCSPNFYFDSETKKCIRDVNKTCQTN